MALIASHCKRLRTPKETTSGQDRAEDIKNIQYSKHDPKGHNSGNSRNGKGKKTIVVDSEQVDIEPSRDRNSTFEPVLIPKGQKYFQGFDDNILPMYARGMSVRDIQSCLLDMYQVDVSEGLISQATEGIMEEVKAWQNRPLDSVYPILFLDCIVVKSREEGKVCNRSVPFPPTRQWCSIRFHRYQPWKINWPANKKGEWPPRPFAQYLIFRKLAVEIFQIIVM